MSQTLSGFSSESLPSAPLSLRPVAYLLQPPLRETYAISAHLQPGCVWPLRTQCFYNCKEGSLLLFSISLSVYSLLPLSLLIPSAFYTAYHITSHHIISKLTGNCNEPRSDSIKMKPFSGAFVKRSIAHNTNTHTAHI